MNTYSTLASVSKIDPSDSLYAFIMDDPYWLPREDLDSICKTKGVWSLCDERETGVMFYRLGEDIIRLLPPTSTMGINLFDLEIFIVRSAWGRLAPV